MAKAIGETRRRRERQVAYNLEHGIEPRSIRKEIHDILSMLSGEGKPGRAKVERLPREIAVKTVAELERRMREHAANLEFERAAALRDELLELRKQLGTNESLLLGGKAPKIFDRSIEELVGN
jgi:excinuclease ABC subunit B